MGRILETLEKRIGQLLNNTSKLVILLAGTSLTSCQQPQRIPESPYTLYEFVGKVKGDNVDEFPSSTTLGSYGRNSAVFSHSKGPESYTFVLETEHGFRTFKVLTWKSAELDALISPGDNLKVHYFGDSSPDSSQFYTHFAIKEINGKKADIFPGAEPNASRMVNSKIIKVD